MLDIKIIMKPRYIIIFVCLLMLSSKADAQFSGNHIGIRGGVYGGVYYQNLVSAGTAESAFFAMASASKNSVRLTVMKLMYETSLTELSDNLFFVWGYGGHLGFSITDNTYFLGRIYQFEHERFRPIAGVDGWAGIEYRFIGIPMAIGLNIKPYFEIMVPGFFIIRPVDIGFSFAYTF